MTRKKIKVASAVASVCLAVAAIVSGVTVSNVFGDTLSFEIPSYQPSYLVCSRRLHRWLGHH
ncbi:MAG: hypothetical protein IJB97_03040, partial [Clostridia bacterium]|nr:hypothetical protein [Clostridia bacterium]